MKYEVGASIRYKGEIPNFTDVGEIVPVEEYCDEQFLLIDTLRAIHQKNDSRLAIKR